MGKILDLIKKTWAENKAFYEAEKQTESFEPINASCESANFKLPKPISNEEYLEKRQAEIDWLETCYDLNSAAGIKAIPERSDLPRPTFGDGGGFRSYTGDVDYYLRAKSAKYEEAGNIELAILCLKKSNAIRMVSRRGYRKDDYYTYVRLLARNGFVDEAYAEKERIDRFFGEEEIDSFPSWRDEAIKRLMEDTQNPDTDLVIMSVHGCACPECAKYQGRVFSVSGADKRFPKIPHEFFKFGGIHKGCTHVFYPFIYGVSDPNLEYTLSIQKVKNRKYIKNIVAFSNRPFVDDRPAEDIAEAIKHIEEMRIAAEKKKDADDHMIEFEAQRGANKREYKWIQENLPEICPKSYSGYMRMKNGNTKNYQKIAAEAKKLGKNIE